MLSKKKKKQVLTAVRNDYSKGTFMLIQGRVTARPKPCDLPMSLSESRKGKDFFSGEVKQFSRRTGCGRIG